MMHLNVFFFLFQLKELEKKLSELRGGSKPALRTQSSVEGKITVRVPSRSLN